ncbi:MAG: CPBP family intramembrane glutamic endopeptidase [Bellilinea sp.]
MSVTGIIALLSEVLGAIAVTMLMTLNPRFKQHRPITFLFPKRESMAAAIVAVGVFVIGFFIFRDPTPAPFTRLTESTPTLEAAIQHLTAAGAGVLLVVIALMYRRQPLRSAGWNRSLFMPALQIGIGIIMLTVFLSGKLSLLMDGISQDESTALPVITLLALAEETIFRGYIQPRFESRIGKIPGWLLTSVLFALWQIPRLLGEPTQTILIGVGLGLVQGLLAGWMMQKSHHVLAPGIYRAISEWLVFIG